MMGDDNLVQHISVPLAQRISVPLARAIFETVRYSDLFDMPVTATQVWRCLVRAEGLGQQEYRLADVRRLLRDSDFLREKLGTQDGYWFLRGRENVVQERLTRHALAQ